MITYGMKGKGKEIEREKESGMLLKRIVKEAEVA